MDVDGETTSHSQLSDHEIADTATFVNAFTPKEGDSSSASSFTGAAIGGGTLNGTSNGDGAVFILGGQRFHFPERVVRAAAFQHSYLALLLKGVTPRGLPAARDENGDVIIENGSNNPEVFRLLLDHLCDKKPLAQLPFDKVTQAYEDLLGEVIQWRLPRTNVTLPSRLWTARRWTDLNAWYALTPRERVLLSPIPVAVQLVDDEFPTPVSTARKLTTEECKSLADEELISDLISNGEAEILAGYCIEDYYCLVAREFNGPTSIDINGVSSSNGPSSSGHGGSGGLLAGFATPGECISEFTCSLYLKLPHYIPHRILTYALPSDFKLPSPPIKICDSTLPAEYPYMYRKRSKVYWWFSINFGLEIAESIDPYTNHIQVKVTQMGHREKQSPQIATPPVSGWLVPRASVKGRDEWICYHPELTPTVKYTSNTKLYKDVTLGTFSIKRIQFYPWGALIVSEHLEPPFAILCIDEVDMKRIYGDRVQVWLRGTSSNLFRSDVDLAVAPDLSRVYLSFCGSLVSQPITPTSTKIVFEVMSVPGSRPRIKMSQVNVAEGSPTGPALNDMSCLGVLADFDPSTGLYYQAEISRLLCTRFIKLQEVVNFKPVDH